MLTARVRSRLTRRRYHPIMSSAAETLPPPAAAASPPVGIGAAVRSAVIWRSGTQIFSQLIAWASTFMVIRILSPSDYGYFAMTTVVMTLLGLINGFSFANGMIQRRDFDHAALRQLFGILIVLNAGLAAARAASTRMSSWSRLDSGIDKRAKANESERMALTKAPYETGQSSMSCDPRAGPAQPAQAAHT